jgi:hypothetical protein
VEPVPETPLLAVELVAEDGLLPVSSDDAGAVDDPVPPLAG